MKTAINTKCVKCGEEKEAIRKHQIYCGSVDPQTGELDQEWGNHRFKPFTPDELEKMLLVELEIAKQMREMAQYMENNPLPEAPIIN